MCLWQHVPEMTEVSAPMMASQQPLSGAQMPEAGKGLRCPAQPPTCASEPGI